MTRPRKLGQGLIDRSGSEAQLKRFGEAAQRSGELCAFGDEDGRCQRKAQAAFLFQPRPRDCSEEEWEILTSHVSHGTVPLPKHRAN